VTFMCCGPRLKAALASDKQKQRLADLFAVDEHVEVEATWGIYQRMIAAYRQPDRTRGRELMSKLVESVSHGVSSALSEPDPQEACRRRSRLLQPPRHVQRANGSDQRTFEHLRGSALGFRNLTNCIARSLLETGGFRPRLHPGM